MDTDKIVTAETLASKPQINLNLMIGFSTSNHWWSKLIRWFTSSKISHCFVAVNLFGARLIIGAEAWGLDWRTKARFEEENAVKAIYKPMALPVDDSFAWFVQTYAGAEYDWGAAGVTGIKTKFTALWKLLNNWLRGLPRSNRLMCEEVPVRILQRAQYASVQTIVPDETSAEAFMQICSKSTEYQLVWKAPGMD